MDPGLIPRLRQGQAEMRDQMLADVLIERGVLTATESPDLIGACEPGAFAARLVESGRVAKDYLARIDQEMDFLEILDTVSDDATPDEVRQASFDKDARVGKYVLTSRLGQGGMGEVWKAWDKQLSRWVAIKFLKVQESQLVRRFMREAVLLGGLSHPNITRVYEVGIHEQKPFLVMELVDGSSLEKKKFDRKRAAKIIRDAARAVQHAHSQGVIHRDLKPSNLLEAKTGSIFVTDFGLARMRTEGSSLTVSGALLGTPSFMAPEQAQGRNADERTDIYGLCATLWAMVEGRPPYVGEIVPEIVKRVATSTAPTLSGEDDLTVVVQKGMERDRQDRYQTAGELADDLDRYLIDEPILARPIGSLERSWRRARRRPVLSATIALLVILVLIGSSWGAIRLRQWQVRLAAERRADVLLAEADSIAENAQRLLSSGRYDKELLDSALSDLETKTSAALTEAPEYTQALFYQGLFLTYSERYSEAEQVFSRILEIDPGHSDARARRGRVLFGSSAPGPTVISDAQGLQFIPDTPDEETKQRMHTASEDFAKLPQTHPDYSYGHALIAYMEGNYEDARDLLRPVLEERPYLTLAWLLLAWSDLATGDYRTADQNASEVLRRGLFENEAYAIRAYSRAARQEWENAIVDATESLSRQPSRELQGFKAFWLFQLQDYEKALLEYNTLLESNPQNVVALLGRSLVYYSIGDQKLALADAEMAVQLQPDNAEAHFQRGTALESLEERVEAFTRTLELQPNYPKVYGLRSLAYLQLDKLEEAEKDALRATELDPGYPGWWYSLGISRLAKGDNLQAEQALTEALRLQPSDGDTHFRRALARYFQGNCQGALEDLAKAAELGYAVSQEIQAEIRKNCQ